MPTLKVYRRDDGALMLHYSKRQACGYWDELWSALRLVRPDERIQLENDDGKVREVTARQLASTGWVGEYIPQP